MIKKLPKCNGRPQLWSRDNFTSLRILYPDGRLEFYSNITNCWLEGTQESSLADAQKVMFEREADSLNEEPEFIGYL